MPEFKAREATRAAKKAEELAPYVEAALKRKTWMKPLADDEIKPVVALGRAIAEQAAARGDPLPETPARAAWRKANETDKAPAE